MKLKIGAAGALILFLQVFTPSAFAQSPTITNITNAAIPAIDYPPVAVQLAPRSIATIFGTNLGDAIVTTSPPWKTTLGGTEVHFVVDTFILNNTRIACQWQTDPACDLIVNLVYVSPTQINFVTPDSSITPSNGSPGPVLTTGRIVLIRDGVRFDARYDISGGPGYMTLDPFGYTRNPDIFGVGYECLFSFSLTDPLACGLSWAQGQHRALLGAVTDISGQLITSQNPVRQGELITLWMTGLTGLNLDPRTGLLQEANPGSVGFGVAQNGNDIPATISFNSFDGTIAGLFKTPVALFAGESPVYMGLDQVNAYFPMCVANAKASVEKRFDAFMDFTSIQTGTHARIYLPFLVSPGDQECGFVNSTMAISSSANPSLSGQSVTFTVIVSPADATGTVQFLDGTAAIGTGAINGGTATLSTSALAVGTHSISATYSGDSNYGGSSATRMQTVNKTPTSVMLTSSPNPSTVGQTVTFGATVSPPTATGTVTFSELTCSPAPCSVRFVPLGTGALSGGKASFTTSSLSADTHLIAAIYSGDTNYGGGTSTNLTQTINKNSTTVTLSSSPNPSIAGQPVTFACVVSPSSATGMVSCGLCSGILSGGQAQCSAIPAGSPGVQSITATYGGDSNYSGSTSAPLLQTIRQNTATTLTSSVNPSTLSQAVTFTALMYFSNATGTITFFDGTATLGSGPVTKAVATFSTSTLTAGSHSITAVYSGDGNFGGSTSVVLVQTVR